MFNRDNPMRGANIFTACVWAIILLTTLALVLASNL